VKLFICDPDERSFELFGGGFEEFAQRQLLSMLYKGMYSR
jgi:hypothetical protein